MADANAPAPVIDPATGAPPPPPAPAPAAAQAPAQPAPAQTDNRVTESVQSPQEKRQEILADTAGIMPKGAVPPAEATAQEAAAEAAKEAPAMPQGALTTPDSKWQTAAEGVPEDGYKEFTVGVGLDENGVPQREAFAPKEGENPIYDHFVQDVKTRGLSQEQAQAELDRVSKYVEISQNREQAARIERAQGWNKELQEWGFLGNPEVMNNVATVMKRYDTRGRVRELFEASGAANMPEIVHMMHELGRRIGTGTGLADGQVMTPNAGPKPLAGSRPEKTHVENLSILVDGFNGGSRSARPV